MKSKSHKYIGEFENEKDKRQFGVRFATSKDAKSISEIMKDAYGFDYLYPKVYSEEQLSKSLKKEEHTTRFVNNELWGIAESMDEIHEPVAICQTKRKNEFSLYAGKTVVHNRFRGMGMGRELGVNSLLNVLKMPENQTIVRLDSDVRCSQLNSQKMAEVAGSIPYGFIPNYNNYADKRSFDPAYGIPFTEGKKEAVIMYVAFLGDFWNIRCKSVDLFDDEDIKSFYNLIQSQNQNMKKDTVTIYQTIPIQSRNKFNIEEDLYKGTILITGYLNQSGMSRILKKYEKWNVIEWRVPTTNEGVYSQKVAIKNKFVISGYDPGSYKINTGQLVDTLVMCRFPNGLELAQFECLDLSRQNRFIATKVINQLSKYYPVCKDHS